MSLNMARELYRDLRMTEQRRNELREELDKYAKDCARALCNERKRQGYNEVHSGSIYASYWPEDADAIRDIIYDLETTTLECREYMCGDEEEWAIQFPTAWMWAENSGDLITAHVQAECGKVNHTKAKAEFDKIKAEMQKAEKDLAERKAQYEKLRAEFEP